MQNIDNQAPVQGWARGIVASIVDVDDFMKDGLAEISGRLGEWFGEYEEKTDTFPLEGTMTDHLILELRQFGMEATRTPGSEEFLEGHDLTIKLRCRVQTGQRRETANWVVFLQAKVLKHGVVDFLYGYDAILHQKERVHNQVKNRTLAMQELDKFLKTKPPVVETNNNMVEECKDQNERRGNKRRTNRDFSVERISELFDRAEAEEERERKLQPERLHGAIFDPNLRILWETRHISAGYIVYSANSVRYIPINDVYYAFIVALQQLGGFSAGQAALNVSMTNQLLGSSLQLSDIMTRFSTVEYDHWLQEFQPGQTLILEESVNESKSNKTDLDSSFNSNDYY